MSHKCWATHSARELRSTPTETEAGLWRLLRSRRFVGYKFRRQHPLGDYVLDFACPERKVAVELDGGGHAQPAEVAADAARDSWLKSVGWRVLRFWNHEVLLEEEAVLEAILAALRDADEAPHPALSPALRGEGK